MPVTGAQPPDGYARVCVEVAPAHLDHPFDYRIPSGVDVGVGTRVRVIFAGRRVTGWVLGTADESGTDPGRVRPLAAVDRSGPWFDESDLRLYRWVAHRYAASLADVLRHALPRAGAGPATERIPGPPNRPAPWPAPGPVPGPVPGPATRPPCPSPAWRTYDAGPLLRAAFAPMGAAFSLAVLPGDDPAALVGDLIARCLASGRTALVLAPDPSSALPGAALALAEGADLRTATQAAHRQAWFACRSGGARVAVGERGAVFAPLRDLGLVVVDDEANPAYKERRSPRHHAREVALARARMAGATCVLLGDVPSAAVWRLRELGHVRHVAADRATQRARAPRVHVVDLSDPRPGTRRARLSSRAAAAVRHAVADGRCAVVLAARRGQGAGLVCARCGRRVACPACDATLRAVREPAASPAWECATCGFQAPATDCPACGGRRISPLQAGAARLAAELERSHPSAQVVRMEGFDAPGPTRRPAIAVMTRGSVVARPAWLGDEAVAAVVVPDADAMWGRAELGAAEDALRLWTGVARWTAGTGGQGRDGGGQVVVQTREPRHPAVQALVRADPDGFWRAEAPRRAELDFPPAASVVAVRAPPAQAGVVAAQLRAALPGAKVLGPDLAGALLVKTRDLRGMLAALTPLRRDWSARGPAVRVDVDPLL